MAAPARLAAAALASSALTGCSWAYIRNPRRFGNRIMPVFGEAFSARQLDQLATFLAASKGVAH